jgi:hypothetical protein
MNTFARWESAEKELHVALGEIKTLNCTLNELQFKLSAARWNSLSPEELVQLKLSLDETNCQIM